MDEKKNVCLALAKSKIEWVVSPLYHLFMIYTLSAL